MCSTSVAEAVPPRFPSPAARACSSASTRRRTCSRASSRTPARPASTPRPCTDGGRRSPTGSAQLDVAVAGHVLYNVADLEPFARSLAAVARSGVVFELTERHPLHWMNDLWLRFHDLERPDGPVAAGCARGAHGARASTPVMERLVCAPARRRLRAESPTPSRSCDGVSASSRTVTTSWPTRSALDSSSARATGAPGRRTSASPRSGSAASSEPDPRDGRVDLVLGVLDPFRLASLRRPLARGSRTGGCPAS